MARRKVTRGSPPRLARPRTAKWGARDSARKPQGRARRAKDADLEPESTLGVYFKEMSHLDVMTAEQEIAAATRIAHLRTEHWRRLLSYPPFICGIVAFVEHELEAEDVPTAELRALRKSARALRDRETRANRDAYASDRDGLAQILAHIDVDGIVADRVLADLESLDAGQREGLTMAVRPPRRGSNPFKEYVNRVRQSSLMLRTGKNRFVKANLRLVVSIARRFNHGRMPLQDLIQEGNIGLMKAVDRFESPQGLPVFYLRELVDQACDQSRDC